MNAWVTENQHFELRHNFDVGGKAVVSRTGEHGQVRISYYGGGRLDHDIWLSVEDIRALAKFADETDAALNRKPSP